MMNIKLNYFEVTIRSMILILGLVLTNFSIAQDLTCSDVEFSQETISNNPDIANACQDVVENGDKHYAKLEAEVVRSGFNRLTLKYKLSDGSWGKPYQTADIPDDFRVMLDGEPYRVRELVRGQHIRVYVEIGGVYAISLVDTEAEENFDMPWFETSMTPVEEVVEVEPPNVEPPKVVNQQPPNDVAASNKPTLLYGIIAIIAFGFLAWRFMKPKKN